MDDHEAPIKPLSDVDLMVALAMGRTPAEQAALLRAIGGTTDAPSQPGAPEPALSDADVTAINAMVQRTARQVLDAAANPTLASVELLRVPGGIAGGTPGPRSSGADLPPSADPGSWAQRLRRQIYQRQTEPVEGEDRTPHRRHRPAEHQTRGIGL